MHCPECEAFTDFVFPRTDLYLWFPLDHTFAKVSAFLGEADFDYELLRQDLVKLSLTETTLNGFLIQLSGVISSQELAGSKALTVREGEEPDVRNLERVVTLEKLVAISHGQWLRELVEQDRYTTYFQPIVSSQDLGVIGHEALFRGFEADGSLLSPTHIFKTAAEAGQMFQLDLAARRSAVQQAAKLDVGNQWVFINFNPTTVYDPSYCLRTTVSACEELGLKPEQIIFEVTETEKVEDMRHLRGILSFYRKAGFRVALDDVGAGYSGLNILQSLGPDLIKIDRHLIENIDTDAFKLNIVEHLTALAHRQQIQVLAEGIETEAEAKTLQELGVDLLQGYYFGRPGPELVEKVSVATEPVRESA